MESQAAADQWPGWQIVLPGNDWSEEDNQRLDHTKHTEWPAELPHYNQGLWKTRASENFAG